jgi:hypothetical protein
LAKENPARGGVVDGVERDYVSRVFTHSSSTPTSISPQAIWSAVYPADLSSAARSRPFGVSHSDGLAAGQDNLNFATDFIRGRVLAGQEHIPLAGLTPRQSDDQRGAHLVPPVTFGEGDAGDDEIANFNFHRFSSPVANREKKKDGAAEWATPGS